MAGRRKLKSLRAMKDPYDLKVVRDADTPDKMFLYLQKLKEVKQERLQRQQEGNKPSK